MGFCIVVARYNENVEWTKQFPNVVIFNKGEKLEDGYNEIMLPNVGKEGHTYYHYICENYDKLPTYTIFLQGNPFDHSPNILSTLRHIVNNIDRISIHFEYLSEYMAITNLSGCSHHAGLPLIETYEKIFNERKTSMEIVFGIGAQFIVSKTAILKKSKDFYSNIVEILQYDKNPLEGYVVERLHRIIFE